MSLPNRALHAIARRVRSRVPDVPGARRVVRLATRVLARGGPVRVDCYGCTFVLDLRDFVDAMIFWERYEVATLRTWTGMIGPGSVVFDVGANIGLYSLLAAKSGAAAVYAFEPNPPTVERLRRNVAENAFARSVVIETRALSDEAGEAMLYDDYNADATVRNRGVASFSSVNAAGEGRRIAKTTIDAFVKEAKLTRLDCLKMDIQGAELQALRGARETMRTLKPRMIVEYDRGCAENMGWSRKDLDALLDDCGYRVSSTVDGVNLIVEPVGGTPESRH